MKKLDRYSFIWKAIQKHGYRYNYTKTKYINSSTKVCIICPIHGEFWQLPYDHLYGRGCSKCSGTKKLNNKDFIEKAKQVHGDKYDYSKVEYKGNKIKVCIICPEHGEFWQRPNDHLSGYGCNKCYGTHLYTTEEFIEKAKKVHGNEYDYSKIEYKGAHTKVCIICPKHGEFWQKPNNHLNGTKCPICNSNKKSKMEENIFDELSIIFDNIERQKTFDWLIYKRKLYLDFFIPKYNIAIEVNGDQHYRPIKRFGGEEYFIKQTKRDEMKKKLCDEHHIVLFYVTKKNFNINQIKEYISNETTN